MKKHSKVTICLPTKNRPDFLQRTLQYYDIAKFEGTILVGDASEGEYHEKCKSIIEIFSEKLEIYYFHLPNTGCNGTFNILTDHISTPYACCSTDDDIVVVDGLENAVSILETDEDISSVNGAGIIIGIENIIFGKINGFNIYYQYSQPNKLASERIKHFLANPKAESFGVRRTEIMKKMFSPFKELSWSNKQTITLDELICSGISVIHGKTLQSKTLYLVRQGNPLAFKRHTPAQLVLQPEWCQAVSNLIDILANELSKKENLSIENSIKILHEAIGVNIENMFSSHFKRKVSKNLYKKRIISNIKKIAKQNDYVWNRLRKIKHTYVNTKIKNHNNSLTKHLNQIAIAYGEKFD